MAKAGLKLKIFGSVQGINFRHHTKQIAEQLGLTGWVKNAPDGTVECLAEGEEKNLKKMSNWCNEGPKWSGVDKVEEQWLDYSGQFDSFNIIY